jgi:hypothetical protein
MSRKHEVNELGKLDHIEGRMEQLKLKDRQKQQVNGNGAKKNHQTSSLKKKSISSGDMFQSAPIKHHHHHYRHHHHHRHRHHNKVSATSATESTNTSMTTTTGTESGATNTNKSTSTTTTTSDNNTTLLNQTNTNENKNKLLYVKNFNQSYLAQYLKQSVLEYVFIYINIKT